jgi:hypothetical protein
MHFKILYIAFLAAALTACNSKKAGENKEPTGGGGNMAGGGCTYEHHYMKAVLVHKEKYDNGGLRIDCVTSQLQPGTSNPDTVWKVIPAYEIADSASDMSKMVNGFKKGDTLTYKQSTIISGSCNPSVGGLELRKFPYKSDTTISE